MHFCRLIERGDNPRVVMEGRDPFCVQVFSKLAKLKTVTLGLGVFPSSKLAQPKPNNFSYLSFGEVFKTCEISMDTIEFWVLLVFLML